MKHVVAKVWPRKLAHAIVGFLHLSFPECRFGFEYFDTHCEITVDDKGNEIDVTNLQRIAEAYSSGFEKT